MKNDGKMDRSYIIAGDRDLGKFLKKFEKFQLFVIAWIIPRKVSELLEGTIGTLY
jgi:hypothetical protein